MRVEVTFDFGKESVGGFADLKAKLFALADQLVTKITPPWKLEPFSLAICGHLCNRASSAEEPGESRLYVTITRTSGYSRLDVGEIYLFSTGQWSRQGNIAQVGEESEILNDLARSFSSV